MNGAERHRQERTRRAAKRCDRQGASKSFSSTQKQNGGEEVLGQLRNRETASRHFECLAHNLCLLMENEIKRLGLKDEVEEKKAKGREKHRKNREGTLLQKTTQFISQAIIRATQRTVRFIRWLQSAIYDPSPVEQTLARLKRVWCLEKS
ncbi:MAG: hypothetical protein HC767_14995 [Akkermansiaceae bacterium]|nr:hypothetical protein [Akkermansiaceae bacterium]